jgi:hypothetical protein
LTVVELDKEKTTDIDFCVRTIAKEAQHHMMND